MVYGLKEKIGYVIAELQQWQNTNELDFIIDKYIDLKLKVESGVLKVNSIKGSVRAYLEVYNDYENPLLGIMRYVEDEVESGLYQ